MNTKNSVKLDIFLGGAGPAGLGCALQMAKTGKKTLLADINEKSGGMCRTLQMDGCRFDIGGHRLLSNIPVVVETWKDMLGEELLEVPRKSSIFHGGRLFKYPLNPWNILTNMPPLESLGIISSFLTSRLLGHKLDDNTYEGWIINRFGQKLYEAFFKTYSERVWGINCKKISSDFAQARIDKLTLGKAVFNAIFPNQTASGLYDKFYYPKYGSGQLYDGMADRIINLGGQFMFKTKIGQIVHENGFIDHVILLDESGKSHNIKADNYVFSLALPDCLRLMSPLPPATVIKAGEKLQFRHFMAVNLIVKRGKIFPEQWIYVHEPTIAACRIQNFSNWSPNMTRDSGITPLTFEYYYSDGASHKKANDEHGANGDWGINGEYMLDDKQVLCDEYAIDTAISDGIKLNFFKREDVEKAFVHRCKNAYPIYDLRYRQYLTPIMQYLSSFKNMEIIGRAGLFNYCNADFALWQGISTAEKIMRVGQYEALP